MTSLALGLIALLFVLSSPALAAGVNDEAEYTSSDELTTGSGTFQDMWNLAAVSGGKVKLLKDVTAVNYIFGTGAGFYEGAVLVPADKDITLDINGFRLNRDLRERRGNGHVIRVEGILTIQDSTDTGADVVGKVPGIMRGYDYSNGGGVYVDGGTVNMLSGSIRGNTARFGGGVYIESGTFNMYNGKITYNDSYSKEYSRGNGGGVYLAGPEAHFHFYGGEISHNDIKRNGQGGGIYNSGGNVTIFGGSIIDNSSPDGSGGGISSSGSLEISGGLIENNSAESKGGIDFSGEFTISGNPKIINNKSGGKPSNVSVNDYIIDPGDAPRITIGELTDGAEIGISAGLQQNDAFSISKPIQIDDGEKYLKYFFADDNENLHLAWDETIKCIMLVRGPGPHEHALNIGCDESIKEGAEEVTFGSRLSSDANHLCINGSRTVIDPYNLSLYKPYVDQYLVDSYLLPAGEYYLEGDITVDKPIEVRGNVKLCLNGNVIKGVDLIYSLMYVAPGAVLDLCDCRPDTLHTDFLADCTVTGGILTGGNPHKTSEHTAGVYSLGGGINVYGGILNMYGGTVYKNQALDPANENDFYHCGGGIYCSNSHSGELTFLNIYGGAVTENSGGNGGGIYFASGNGAEFNMYGGIVERNYAAINGAGIYNENTFIMHGGEIRNNEAPQRKGGIGGDGAGVLNTREFTMKGGKITGNIAKRNGGGVYLSIYSSSSAYKPTQTFTVFGNPQIYDNIGTYSETPDDFYSSTGNIMIGELGLEDGARIGVRKDPKESTLAALYDTKAEFNPEYVKYFFADDSRYHIEACEWSSTYMGLKLVEGAAHEHNSITFNTSFSPSMSPLPAGGYYLTRDIRLTDTVTVKGNVNLCLNGHSITGPSDGSPAFRVPSGAALKVYNEEGTGGFAGLSGSGGIQVDGGGWLEMMGETTVTYAPASGGGLVTVDPSGTVTTPGGGGGEPPVTGDHKDVHPDPGGQFKAINADNFGTVTQVYSPDVHKGTLPDNKEAYRYLTGGKYYLEGNFTMPNALVVLNETDFCLNGSNLGADNDTWLYELGHVFWVPDKAVLNVLDCQRNLHIIWLYGGRVFLKNGGTLNITDKDLGLVSTIEMVNSPDSGGQVTVYKDGSISLPKGAKLTQKVSGKPDQIITNNNGVLEATTSGAGAATTKVTPPGTGAPVKLKLAETAGAASAVVLEAPANSTVQTGTGPEIKLEQPGEIAADGTVSGPKVTVTAAGSDPGSETGEVTVTAPAGKDVQVSPRGETQAPAGSTVAVDNVSAVIEEIGGDGTGKTVTVQPNGEVNLPAGSKVTAGDPQRDGVSVVIALPGEAAQGTLGLSGTGVTPPAGSSVTAKKGDVTIVIALPGGGGAPEIKFGGNGSLILPPGTQLTKQQGDVTIVIALPGDGEAPEVRFGDSGALILPPGTTVTKGGKTETVTEGNNVLDPNTGELTDKEPERPSEPSQPSQPSQPVHPNEPVGETTPVTPDTPVSKPNVTVEMDDKGEITVTPTAPGKPPVVIKPQNPDDPGGTPAPPVVDETGTVFIDAPFKVETENGPDITAEKGGSVDPEGNVTGETVTVERKKPDGTTEDVTLTAPENDAVKVGPNGEAQVPAGTEIKQDDVKVTIDELPDPEKPAPVKPDGGLDLPGGSKITVTPEQPQQPDQKYTVTLPEQGGEVKLDKDVVILPPGSKVVDQNGRETTVPSGGGALNLSTGEITGTAPAGGGGGSGGGGGARRSIAYVIMASSSIGGTISPDKRVIVRSGGDQTFVIEPAEGYVISDVLVDDKSVGQVTSYTFRNVRSDHTIQALFVAEGASGHGHPQDCPKDETCPIWPYTDSIPTDWYHDGVHYCIENRLMIGTSQALWEPDIPLTRAMMAQVLYNKAGQPEVSGGGVFDDVSERSSYWPAITWGGRNHVLRGYDESRYGPSDYITREQLAAMLWRYAGQPQADGQLSFSDADEVSDYARQALSWASRQGVVLGYQDGTFRPKNNASRAEAAQIIMRYFQL